MLKTILSLLFPREIVSCTKLVAEAKQEEFTSDVSLISFFDYKQEEVKKVILTLKEHESKELAKEVSSLISNSLNKKISQLTKSRVTRIYLVPIPARKQRLDEFGFNQTEILCYELSKVIPKSKTILLLERNKQVSKQAHKNKHDRQREIRGTMQCVEKIPETISKESLFIIVDDVITTGSTLKEGLRALQDSGAQKVLVLSLSRA